MEWMTEEKQQFPDGFLWGASMSAHQVEGDNTNSDWWAWEHSPKRVAELKKKGLDPSDFQSGKAADHYRRFRDDFALAEKLNLNAIRLSIEWARIEPEEGVFDEDALRHYVEVVRDLKKRGIEPIVTLHHQTNPLWFSKNYTWKSSRSVDLFSGYVKKVVEALKDEVTWWTTLNEPKLIVLRGGPGRIRKPFGYMQSLNHLVEAHKAAYSIIRELNPNAKVSVAYSFQAWSTSSTLPINQALVHTARFLDREWFIGKILDSLDYIGVNYYRAYHFGFRGILPAWKQRGSGIVSDMNWEVYPHGLYHIAHNLSERYRKPLLITENGIADKDDTRRAYFIVEHLRALYEAIKKGADIRGYCHWALTDNFEWEHGFSPRFGLIAIDYETQKRTIRESAKLYADIAKHNELPKHVEEN